MVDLVGGQLFSEQLVGCRCFLRSVVGGSSGRCLVQYFEVSGRWSMDPKSCLAVCGQWLVGGFVPRRVISVKSVHMRQTVILA